MKPARGGLSIGDEVGDVLRGSPGFLWRLVSGAFLGIRLAVAIGLALACSSSLPTPKTGTPPEASINYVEVPFPPPAARVEVVAPRPQPGAVWVDGEWTWQGRRWSWEPGGWVVPPVGYYAPWRTKRLDNGKLLFAPSTWRDAKNQVIPKPAILVPAQNSLEDEEPADAAALPEDGH